MTTEIALLLLRLLSSLLLLGLLAALFIILRRDLRSAMSSAEANRRVYGQLLSLREVNGSYIPTGTKYPLLRLTSIGRSPGNTVTVEDTFASNEHALVALRKGQWWLEDRQSRNGTTLNEIRITQAVIITDGDIIGIGAIRFRLELEQ